MNALPRRYVSGVAIAVAGFLVSLCAAGADETAPVEKPDLKVGDQWRYRSTDYPGNVPKVRNSRVSVSFVGPAEVLTVSGSDKDSVWTAEWGALSRGGSGVTFDKPRRLFNFPLKVGTSHQISYEVVARRKSDARSRYEETIRVVGWEEVVVPAGTFRALKIESEGRYQRLDTKGGGSLRRDIWYVPEVKRWVKWSYREGHGAPHSLEQKNLDELISYLVQR